jgi:hypothetical protein
MGGRGTLVGAFPSAPLALALSLILSATPAPAQALLEQEVKATYLYKLAPYVSWPADPGASFNICVVGTDPFGDVLDRAVAGVEVARRPIMVRRVAVANRDAPCQIAYLGGSSAQSVKEALRLLQGAPVLTVTEGPASPGIVDFEVMAGRVRFHIDDEMASQSGLTISSKLLGLALSVKPRTHPEPGR